ncbi:MAG: hypothetical protein ACM359_02845, partial [Bacillota bacterium]
PYHLIVSNPPYIRSEEIPKLDRNVRDYEPITALDGGPDGLAVYRRILAGAGDRLVSGGKIYIEIAFDQGELAKQVAGEYPAFGEVKILKDYGGRDRVMTARRA